MCTAQFFGQPKTSKSTKETLATLATAPRAYARAFCQLIRLPNAKRFNSILLRYYCQIIRPTSMSIHVERSNCRFVTKMSDSEEEIFLIQSSFGGSLEPSTPISCQSSNESQDVRSWTLGEICSKVTQPVKLVSR